MRKQLLSFDFRSDVEEVSMPVKWSMNVVSKRTGLTQHVIRVWERRYGAVKPTRAANNRRLYLDEDVTRLILLRQLTAAGHQIGSIARLSTEDLEALSRREVNGHAAAHGGTIEGTLLHEAVRAVKSLDRVALEDAMRRGAVALGAHGLLEKLVAPLTDRIGEMWRDGVLTAAHEHFASAVIRQYLGGSTRPFAPGSGAPNIVVTTPSGQLHELGAIIVAAAAADIGWHVTYLGASLPPAEIAAVATQNRSRAVALSIVYPEDDPHLPREIEMLRKYLPAGVAILAGGRAAPGYSAVLEKVGALQPASLKELYDELNRIRKS